MSKCFPLLLNCNRILILLFPDFSHLKLMLHCFCFNIQMWSIALLFKSWHEGEFKSPFIARIYFCQIFYFIIIFFPEPRHFLHTFLKKIPTNNNDLGHCPWIVFFPKSLQRKLTISLYYHHIFRKKQPYKQRLTAHLETYWKLL